MAKYIPTTQSTLENYFAWRAQQQLGKPTELAVARTITTCGWLSPVPRQAVLSLYARGYDDATTALREAVQASQVAAVRTLRGQRLIVERSMVPYALALAEHEAARRNRLIWREVGVFTAELTAWREQVLAMLGDATLNLSDLAERVPKRLTEPLSGSASKRAGRHRTLLPLLIAEMEEEGLVHEYEGSIARYEVRFPKLRRPSEVDREEARKKVVERFFAWGNVANASDLAEWTGWSVRQCELLLFSGELPLNHLVLAGSKTLGLMIHSQHAEPLRLVKPQREPPVYFLPARDPMYAYIPNLIARICDEAQRAVLFHPDRRTLRPLILEGGRPVGAWQITAGALEWIPAGRTSPALRRKVEAVLERLSAWVRTHGLLITDREESS